MGGDSVGMGSLARVLDFSLRLAALSGAFEGLLGLCTRALVVILPLVLAPGPSVSGGGGLEAPALPSEIGLSAMETSRKLRLTKKYQIFKMNAQKK